MILLGIETSCDETAVALVQQDKVGGGGNVLADQLASQQAHHTPYGGIVPEIAARAHGEWLDGLVAATMKAANLGFSDIDGVAATCGPGLMGGLIVGATLAKMIALVHALPFIAVNHLEAHALSSRLMGEPEFPYALLLASGGHCQAIVAEDVGQYDVLGTTCDDSPGEALDKAAKMLGLSYPSGSALEQAAQDGDSKRYILPRPMMGRGGCDFSFAGLKTAFANLLKAEKSLAGGTFHPTMVRDLAACFQTALCDCLLDRSYQLIRAFQKRYGKKGTLVAAGGVIANRYLRSALADLTVRENMQLILPPIQLCTDNAIMVAWAGIERLQRGHINDITFSPRPRWPLTDLTMT